MRRRLAWRSCAASATRQRAAPRRHDSGWNGSGTEHAALTAVSVPDEANQLDEQRRAAADAVTEAARALQEAEQADAAARAARDSAVAEAPLQQASRDLRDLQDLIADLGSARRGLERAHSGRSAADAALASAEDAPSRAPAGPG